MNSQILPEHEWFQKLVGDWTFETTCDMGPDQPAKFNGSESVRLLGGLWAICEGRGNTPDGGTATNIMTLGYDPGRKRYTGTFIASMMAHLWIYDGSLDPTGRVLTLNADGPSFKGDGKITRYQDIIEIISDDHRTLSSQTLGDDGVWRRFMEAHYRRNK